MRHAGRALPVDALPAPRPGRRLVLGRFPVHVRHLLPEPACRFGRRGRAPWGYAGRCPGARGHRIRARRLSRSPGAHALGLASSRRPSAVAGAGLAGVRPAAARDRSLRPGRPSRGDVRDGVAGVESRAPRGPPARGGYPAAPSAAAHGIPCTRARHLRPALCRAGAHRIARRHAVRGQPHARAQPRGGAGGRAHGRAASHGGRPRDLQPHRLARPSRPARRHRRSHADSDRGAAARQHGRGHGHARRRRRAGRHADDARQRPAAARAGARRSLAAPPGQRRRLRRRGARRAAAGRRARPARCTWARCRSWWQTLACCARCT